jgi:hypothetical protein
LWFDFDGGPSNEVSAQRGQEMWVTYKMLNDDGRKAKWEAHQKEIEESGARRVHYDVKELKSLPLAVRTFFTFLRSSNLHG